MRRFSMPEISIADARLALAETHGFTSSELREGKEGVLAFFQRHKCVQSDPIEVAGRNADLTLQSRICDYRRKDLTDLLYEDRRLFEYFCKMMSILPVETFPVFRRKMRGFERRRAQFFVEYRKETNQVLRMLRNGPVSPRELADLGRMDWGWGHKAKISNVILTRLWVSGKVMVHHREGAVKYYALTEQVIPKKYLAAELPAEEAAKEIALLIVKASRLVSSSRAPEQWFDVGKTKEVEALLGKLEREGKVFSLKVEGWRDKLYAPIEDMGIWNRPKDVEEDYVRFLAPLDPLLWNRQLFRTIYGLDYAWEVYKRPKERKYGYYCLPILFNGDAVGLMDPFFRKKDRVLEIRNFHLLARDIDMKRFLSALGKEMKRFCDYLGAEKIEVGMVSGLKKKMLTEIMS